MTPQIATADERPASRASSVAASAGLGVLAAAIGYLLTYVVIRGEVREVFGDDVAEWKGVAWYYYNAHMVDVEASGQFGSFGGTETLNFIAESSGTSAGLLYVLPPLALVAAGAFLAVQWNVSDVGEAVIVGAPMTIGYAVVLTLGAVVAEASTQWSAFGLEASGSIAPAFGPAIVLGGVLYPLVFATGGAIVAAALASR